MISYQMAQPTIPTTNFDTVLGFVQSNSDRWTKYTPKALSRKMGQVFTPTAMAKQLVTLLPESGALVRETIGDPGCGTGILSLVLAAHLTNEQIHIGEALGFETDARLHQDWQQAWDLFREQAHLPIQDRLLEDFTAHAEQLLSSGEIPGTEKPSYITTNPPFIKVAKSHPLSKTLTKHGIPVPNMYAAFVVLACCWLKDDGHLLAVLPRSFASGVYFKAFRHWLGAQAGMSVEHVVLYKSRSCFKNVLQENLLIYLKKSGTQSPRVRISVADTPLAKPEYDLIMPADSIISDDGWMLPRCGDDIDLINNNRRRAHNLEELGIQMSSGKLELHRLKGSELSKAIYARDFDKHGNWTWAETKKPRTVLVSSRQVLHLPEKGGYIALKRISSNDGDKPQRIFPVWLCRDTVKATSVTLDNHIQYLHKQGKPFDELEGKRLENYLRSEEVQAVVRAVSGTTQINRSDLEKVKFD